MQICYNSITEFNIAFTVIQYEGIRRNGLEGLLYRLVDITCIGITVCMHCMLSRIINVVYLIYMYTKMDFKNINTRIGSAVTRLRIFLIILVIYSLWYIIYLIRLVLGHIWYRNTSLGLVVP